MRATIQMFDNSDGTATACRATVYDDAGRVIGTHQTRYYRTYPRMVRASNEAENAVRLFARKRLMTCTIEHKP